MRLRLRVERNALPPTQALWPTKDNKITVAQLLEQINKTFPLEADTWGLEDYSVSVGGFECLHYQEVGAVCRDEDEVVIKPLQFVDLRSRTLNGRNQIAEDGRHLVDGVPFGRPALKDPVRPDIAIPPRKKRKLSGEIGEGNEYGHVLMLTENGENLEEGEDEDDDDEYEGSATNGSSSGSSSAAEDATSEGSNDSSADEQRSGSDSEESVDETDDSESWDGIPNSEPPTPSRKGEMPVDSTSTNHGQAPHQSLSNQNGTKRKRSLEDQHQSSLESQRDLNVKRQLATDESHPRGLPFEGKSVTKARNARRRDAKKLTYLKSIGELPDGATLEMARQHQASNGLRADARAKETSTLGRSAADSSEHRSSGESTVTDSDVEEKGAAENGVDNVMNTNTRKASSISIEAAGKEILGQQPQVIATTAKKRKRSKQAESGATRDDELEQKRQKLLSAIASGGIDVTSGLDGDDDGPPTQMSSKEQIPPTPIFGGEEIPAPLPSKAAAMLANPATPRSKLDLAGSKRLVFGSLGVRVPKTQEDKDALQKKLAERPSRNVHTEQADVSEANGTLASTIEGDSHEPGAEHVEGTDTWKDKIHLTAVECCDAGVTLSAPPFPFHQRWDPQYRKKKQKANKRINGKYMEQTGKKRKVEALHHDFVETYDKYHVNGDGDVLNYDDPEDEDEYWEEGALLDNGHEDQDEDDESSFEDDGFPSPPSNPDELPILTEETAETGDFVTFTELACDESTEWQPRMVTRMAQLCSLPEPDGENKTYIIQLASRDLPKKIFDDEGNRVYSKFDMPDADIDDEDRQERLWEELGLVRLVSRAE